MTDDTEASKDVSNSIAEMAQKSYKKIKDKLANSVVHNWHDGRCQETKVF